MSINAAPLEDWVAAEVLTRLDSPEMEELLIRRATADSRNTTQAVDLVQAQQTMTDLARLFGAGQIWYTEYLAAREAATERRETALRKLDRLTGTNALDGLAETGASHISAWKQLTLERQSTVVRTVVQDVVIQARPRGARKFDSSRVDIVWA